MVDTNFRVKNGLVVNGAITINSTAIYLNASNIAVVNATTYTGTSNNTLNLGGLPAVAYQASNTLAANVARLSANNSSFLNGVPASSYLTTTGLASNVQTLSANNANNLGGLPSNSYVTNTFLSATYATINAPSFSGAVRIGNTVTGGSLI